MTVRCFRCNRELDEHAKSIMLMYPAGDPTDVTLYSLPRKFCSACMRSFYDWIKEGKE